MRMASLGYSPHEETNSRGKNRSAQWGASWRCDVTNLGSWIMLRHCLQTPMQFNKVFHWKAQKYLLDQVSWEAADYAF
ncbi:hypothetical protein EE612_048966 [Oryza sativa]|nr:hypothetical protein EE612_048966 [Oryza sativa]